MMSSTFLEKLLMYLRKFFLQERMIFLIDFAERPVGPVREG